MQCRDILHCSYLYTCCYPLGEVGQQSICDNGMCVDLAQLCDGVDDCGGDMYDEVYACGQYIKTLVL